MNLSKKKSLAVRALKVGEGRIKFLQSRIDKIKEAITKQDIRELQKEGAIIVKEIKGKKKSEKKNKKRGAGKIKKTVNKRKQEYVKMVRKQRGYVAELKRKGELNKEEVIDIRKKIRNKQFRSKAHLKEFIRGLKK